MINLDAGELTVLVNGDERKYCLGTREAFDIIGEIWLRAGWDVKYLYSLTWLGRPILQLPDDLLRLQEIVWAVKPDLIIETGVAHGGSLTFFASLLHVWGRGLVVGVEKGLMDSTRTAIKSHPLNKYMTIVEGSSTDRATVEKIEKLVGKHNRVLILLDSNHSYQHVLDELNIYSRFVTKGSWIIACDGIIGEFKGAPRVPIDVEKNNATEAAKEFLKLNSEFELLDPPLLFNESSINRSPTYWRGGFLRRKS
jgi:cephalosporin hydroxylase